MKIVKPRKMPVLARVLERARSRPELHVAAMLGFPLDAPRALLDELAFWDAARATLGTGVLDEGFAKARGEMLVAGSFYAPGGVPLPASFVRAKVGAVDKRLAVLGDRLFRDHRATDPEPMTAMPIDWAHAFGGRGFARNPYGKGIEPFAADPRAVPLPNVDHYGALLRTPADAPEPAGLLPMDATFAQRRGRAGTYDERWVAEDFPCLPADAAPTFFNVAPDDQWLDGYFRGDEEVLVENMHPERPRIEGRLPGLVGRCFLTLRTPEGNRFVEVPLRFDTVWLLPAAGLGVVIAHGAQPIAEDDAEDVVHLLCACEDPAAPRPIEHYERTLARRLDQDKGALASLSDSDIMPSRASGVAPDVGAFDVGRWTRTDNLLGQNVRRGMERTRSELRAMVEGRGKDPSTYGLSEPFPEPAAPPLDDLDAVAAYMEAESARAEALVADAQAREAAARTELRATCARLGADFDAIMTAHRGGGPPTFSAADHVAMLERAGRDGAARRAELEEQERALHEMYRRFAHLQPAAGAMDAESAARIRVLVALAAETGESLARRDFTGADLSGMSLRGMDLAGTFLERAALLGCDLAGAVLDGAVLTRARLDGATLTGATLRSANLGGAQMSAAVLENADLADAVLAGADLRHARCAGATFEGADWHDAALAHVDLSRAKLGRCTFIKADLRGAAFVEADISGAIFIDCALQGADFARANLTKATFVTCTGEGASFREARLAHAVMARGCSFPRADFQRAAMDKANLRGTVLEGAAFDRAGLGGADLSTCEAAGASFEHASLVGALLVRADLGGALLVRADLMDVLASKARIDGADFRGANLYRADLSRARGDHRTTFVRAEVGRVRFLPKATVREVGR